MACRLRPRRLQGRQRYRPLRAANRRRRWPKEAADTIRLEKSLLMLDKGVVEGRTTFCNLLKYIRMTASSNFGNALSVRVASAFLPFLPMLPLQLLVQNLLYDIGQTGNPFDAVDAEVLWLPQSPLAGHFKLQALPAAYHAWLVAILMGYCTIATMMKRAYIRLYGWQ